MNARVFTQDKAMALLPQVREIVESLLTLRGEIIATRERISVLETLWNDDIRDENNPDADEYRRCKIENRRHVRSFRTRAEELDELGCHVKDLDLGLIGFFCVFDDRPAFMVLDVRNPVAVEYESLDATARVFTLSDARNSLPRLRAIFDRFDEIGSEIAAARARLSVLEVIWGTGIAEETVPDASEAKTLTRAVDRLVDEGRTLERDLIQTGCVLKDFQQGLVDFYHVRDGMLVFLCWRRDEPDILAWHSLDSGFALRQPIGTEG